MKKKTYRKLVTLYFLFCAPFRKTIHKAYLWVKGFNITITIFKLDMLKLKVYLFRISAKQGNNQNGFGDIILYILRVSRRGGGGGGGGASFIVDL